jgi:hypothetical protein
VHKYFLDLPIEVVACCMGFILPLNTLCKILLSLEQENEAESQLPSVLLVRTQESAVSLGMDMGETITPVPSFTPTWVATWSSSCS